MSRKRERRLRIFSHLCRRRGSERKNRIKYSSIARQFFTISKSFCHKLLNFLFALRSSFVHLAKVHKLFNRGVGSLMCVFLYIPLGFYDRKTFSSLCEKASNTLMKASEIKPCMNHKRNFLLTIKFAIILRSFPSASFTRANLDFHPHATVC